MPNELTPARRGRPSVSHGRSSPETKNGLVSIPSLGLGAVKCTVGGISPCSSASTVLMSPVTPAAVSRWPRLVFTAPTAQKPTRSVCAR